MKKYLTILVALVLALTATAALADHPVTGASGLTKLLAGAGGASQSGGFPAHTAAQIGAPAAAAHIKDMRPQAGPVINNARVLNDSVATRYFIQLCADGLIEYEGDFNFIYAGLGFKFGDDVPDGMAYTVTTSWDIFYDGKRTTSDVFHNVTRSGVLTEDPDLGRIARLINAEINVPDTYQDDSLIKFTTGGATTIITLGNGSVYTFNHTLNNPIPWTDTHNPQFCRPVR